MDQEQQLPDELSIQHEAEALRQFNTDTEDYVEYDSDEYDEEDGNGDECYLPDEQSNSTYSAPEGLTVESFLNNLSEDNLSETTGITDTNPDPEACLTVNTAYKYVLMQAIKNISDIQDVSKLDQSELEQCLSDFRKSKRVGGKTAPRWYRGSLLVFGYPYFKDINGMYAPSNIEEQERKSEGFIDGYIQPPRIWDLSEKKKLMKCVRENLMEIVMEPYLNKKELLRVKISKSSDEEAKDIAEKINLIDQALEDFKFLPTRELLPLTDRPVDWLKISATDFDGTRSATACELMWNNSLHSYININQWTKAEDERLLKIAEKWQYRNWDEVAKELHSNRSAFQCAQRYHRDLHCKIKYGPFTKHEDEVLKRVIKLCTNGEDIPWRQLSYYIDGRTRTQVFHRYQRALDPSIKKGPWSKHEDAMLVSSVLRHGEKWPVIQEFLPGRTPFQCRERYVNCFSGNLKFGKWSPEDDMLMLDLVKKYGVGKWTAISKEMPWRSDNMILNRFRRIKRIFQNLGDDLDELREAVKGCPQLYYANYRNTSGEERKTRALELLNNNLRGGREKSKDEFLVDEEKRKKIYNTLLKQHKEMTERNKQREAHASLGKKPCTWNRKKGTLPRTVKGRAVEEAIAEYIMTRPIRKVDEGFFCGAFFDVEGKEAAASALHETFMLPPYKHEDSTNEQELRTFFSKNILGTEKRPPVPYIPFLPPNQLTVSAYSSLNNRLESLVTTVKKSEGLSDHEELHVLESKSSKHVHCSQCKSKALESDERSCEKCKNLEQFYKEFVLLQNRFLSTFAWPAVLNTLDPPEVEKRSVFKGKKKYYRPKRVRKPWIKSYWRKKKSTDAQPEDESTDAHPGPSEAPVEDMEIVAEDETDHN